MGQKEEELTERVYAQPKAPAVTTTRNGVDKFGLHPITTVTLR